MVHVKKYYLCRMMNYQCKIGCIGLVTALMMCSCNEQKQPHPMSSSLSSNDTMVDTTQIYHHITLDSTEQLQIYYPHFKRIDLVCGTMPQPTDTSIIMVCAAAFTGQVKKEFSHENIAGNHVSGGVYHKGYPCKANTGAFVYVHRQWKFVYQDYAAEVARAADESGMGFGQMMLINNGLRMPANVVGKNICRALCERKGKLCIIESRQPLLLIDFIKFLGRYGVTQALYLDMGEGWNYSWYRDNQGIVQYIHPKTHDYGTNWITFYR